jgi:hypothetical protein
MRGVFHCNETPIGEAVPLAPDGQVNLASPATGNCMPWACRTLGVPTWIRVPVLTVHIVCLVAWESEILLAGAT